MKSIWSSGRAGFSEAQPIKMKSAKNLSVAQQSEAGMSADLACHAQGMVHGGLLVRPAELLTASESLTDKVWSSGRAGFSEAQPTCLCGQISCCASIISMHVS